MTLRPEAASDHHRTAAAFQDRGHLGLVERVTEFRFLVLELRAQILSQLGEQILLPIRFGQPEADGLQVAIDQIYVAAGCGVHNDASWRILLSELLMFCHSSSS